MTIKFIQHEEQNFFKSMKKCDRTCGTPSTVIAERKQREDQREYSNKQCPKTSQIWKDAKINM